MSAEEFESWTETMEVMQQFPDLDKDIAKADKAIRTGDFSGYILPRRVREKMGF